MARGSIKKRCPCRDDQGREVKGCKRDHGSWTFVISLGRDEKTGRLRQLKRGGFKKAGDAQAAMTVELAALDQGTWTDDRGMTVGRWLDQWLADLEHAGRSPKTLANYRGHVRDLWKPKLGAMKLRDVRRTHIENALKTLRGKVGRRPGLSGRHIQERSAGTIDGYRRTIRAALTAARYAGLVTVNVAEGPMVAIPAAGGPDEDAVLWTPEQTAAFLDLAAVHEIHASWSAIFEIAAYAGLRRGELLGARWEDLDDDEGGLRIRQTLVETSSQHVPESEKACVTCGGEHKGMFLKRPKSAAGRRWVPLVPRAQAALAVHRLAQADHKRLLGPDYADHGLIFAMPDGTPIRPGRVTAAFHEIARDASLPPGRLHDLRDGACSILLDGGVPIEVVSMILGHASTAVTRKHYAHVIQASARAQAADAVRPLDELRGERTA